MKEISADKIRFQDLNRETIFSFGDWIETERNCFVATRNIRLAALSSFASYAQNRNTDAALSFVTAIQNTPTKKAAYTPRISFSRAEVSALLHAPDTNSVIRRRDVVLLSLMYASGARAQEICDLRVSDVLFEKDTSRVVLTGKGKKARRICIASSCAEMLRRYLIWRKIDQQLDRHVFSSRTHEQMIVSCIEAIFKKYLAEAKRQNPALFHEKSYSPHTMRHAAAMHMLEAGVPMISIKNFLGHAHLEQSAKRYSVSGTGKPTLTIRRSNQVKSLKNRGNQLILDANTPFTQDGFQFCPHLLNGIQIWAIWRQV